MNDQWPAWLPHLALTVLTFPHFDEWAAALKNDPIAEALGDAGENGGM
jgi:hypothetical protein